MEQIETDSRIFPWNRPSNQKTADYYLPNKRQYADLIPPRMGPRVKARNDLLLLYFTAAGLNKSKHRIWREHAYLD